MSVTLRNNLQNDIDQTIINRVTCLLKPSTPQSLERKTPVTSNTEFHNRYELLQSARRATATKKKVCMVTPVQQLIQTHSNCEEVFTNGTLIK